MQTAIPYQLTYVIESMFEKTKNKDGSWLPQKTSSQIIISLLIETSSHALMQVICTLIRHQKAS